MLVMYLDVQDTDGDVLYVWTTLNLRAEHGFGNLYNQTYVLGMSDDNVDVDFDYDFDNNDDDVDDDFDDVDDDFDDNDDVDDDCEEW